MKSEVKLRRSPLHSIGTRVTLLTLGIFIVSPWSLSIHVSWLPQQDMERLSGEQQFFRYLLAQDRGKHSLLNEQALRDNP